MHQTRVISGVGSHLLREEPQGGVRLPQPSGLPAFHSQPRASVPFKRSAVRREEEEEKLP